MMTSTTAPQELFIANNMPMQSLAFYPVDLFRLSLEDLVRLHPPQDDYTGTPDSLIGLVGGPTSVAYLMLQLFARHPDFELLGHDLMYWSKQYVHGNRGSHVLEDGNCGMSSECIAIDVMRACVTKERRYVMALLEHMPRLLAIAAEETGDKFPAEMIVGRAGMLHMFRMVRHWVPDCADLVEDPMRQLARRIVDKDDDGKGTWMFRNTRYFGAPHGDIGTVVQILLCDPSHAPELAALVEELLDLQTPEGNWIRSSKELEEGKQATLVQYCHGAPGFVYALQSLRPFYPELGERIDRAIERAREVTWEKGLLKKEPSLCHGILGNALVFPKGPRRDHFLALATPAAVAEARQRDATIFEPADYGFAMSATLGYLGSAAWAWSAYNDDEPRMLLFNEI